MLNIVAGGGGGGLNGMQEVGGQGQKVNCCPLSIKSGRPPLPSLSGEVYKEYKFILLHAPSLKD